MKHETEIDREGTNIVLSIELDQDRYDLLKEIFKESNDFIRTGIIHKNGFDYLSISIDKIQFFYLIPLNLDISFEITSFLVKNELKFKFFCKSKSFLFLSKNNELTYSFNLPIKLISYIRMIYKNNEYITNDKESITIKNEIDYEEFYDLFKNSYLYKLDLYEDLLKMTSKSHLITMEEFLTIYTLLDHNEFQDLNEEDIECVVRPVLVQKENVSIEFLFFIFIFKNNFIFNVYDYNQKDIIINQLNKSDFLNFIFINKDINSEYQVKDYVFRKDIDYSIFLQEHNYQDNVINDLKEDIMSYNVISMKNYIEKTPGYSVITLSE